MGWNETRNPVTSTEILRPSTTTEEYIELEQQIHDLTGKHELTEAEKRVLNTVGTTLQNKFQQDTKQRILHEYT
jgi:hypothetical protein